MLRNTFDNYFQGNVSLFERSSLNIKVSLSEDMLDNFKVLRLLRREVLLLCFVRLVCFLLHCGVDDKDCECILHHGPVLCNLQFNDVVDIEHDFKNSDGLRAGSLRTVFMLISFLPYSEILRKHCTFILLIRSV